MSRAKLALVILFHGLWLLASGQPLLNCCDAAGAGASSGHRNAFESSKDCASHPLQSSDIASGLIHSRAGKYSGKTNLSTPALTSCTNRVQNPQPTCSPQRQSPAALATPWQFACRAALEPRAPSFVS